MTSVYNGYIQERDGNCCVLCRSVDALHVHHIKTRGSGGTDDYDNLITLCAFCHSTRAHGKDSKRFRELFLSYTEQFIAPDFWPRVMELSRKKHEKDNRIKSKSESNKYSVKIEVFKLRNGGLSPTQVAYQRQKQYKQKQNKQHGLRAT